LILVACSAAPTAPVAKVDLRQSTDWGAVIAKGYAVPPGADAFELSKELSAQLASPSPQSRDEHAFGIFANWILKQHVLSPEQMRFHCERWRANLQPGIGERGTDTVFLRSFSALALSLLAAEDVQRPFLAPGEVRELLNAALEYLHAERDLRDYDRTQGWIHATAHTADLLKFLARNAKVDAAGLRAILDGIAAKLAVPMDGAFRMGEDERLARAVVSIVLRAECDEAMFAAFLGEMRVSLDAARAHEPWDPAHFAIEQNLLHCLRALQSVLVSAGSLPPQAERARDALAEWFGSVR
jgi:hypothetical protein